MTNPEPETHAEQEAVPEVAPSHPPAIPSELWQTVPEDLREEVLERFGWIRFRQKGDPSVILNLTYDSMQADLDFLETRPSWDTIRDVAHSWPTIRRLPSGHYRHEILRLAEAVSRLAWAEIEEPGAAGYPAETLRHLLPDPDFAPILIMIFENQMERFHRWIDSQNGSSA